MPANTDSLAQAQAIIAGGFATANFLARTIDRRATPALRKRRLRRLSGSRVSRVIAEFEASAK